MPVGVERSNGTPTAAFRQFRNQHEGVHERPTKDTPLTLLQ